MLLVWQHTDRGDGPRYICIVCRDGRPRVLKHCAEHELSNRHKAAIAYCLQLRSPQNEESNDASKFSDELMDQHKDQEEGDDMNQYDVQTRNQLSGADINYLDDAAYFIDSTEEEQTISRMSSSLTP